MPAAALAAVAWAADWPMPGGNPQRNGWAGSERQITKANVNSLKLLYKYQADNVSGGTNSLTSPIISGNLITYRGFKEMLMFAGSSDTVFSIDADLNQLIWKTKLATTVPQTARKTSDDNCPEGLTSPVVMAGSSSNSLHFAALAARAPVVPGTRPAHPSPYFPPLAQSVYPLRPTTLTELNAVYTVSSDGYLHTLNSSTGQDLIQPVRFVPPNAKITSLNLRDNIVYATTADNCDGYKNALFAIDILSPEKTVRSFVPAQDGFAGALGTSISNDGKTYVQAAYPKPGDVKHTYETVLALSPKELKVQDYFTIGDKAMKADAGLPGITPVVFSFPRRDIVVAGGRDGKIYLLDSKSLGGPDHRTPLFATPEIATRPKKNARNGFRGAFSTWFDVDTGTRRIYATVFGPLWKTSGFTPTGSAMRKASAHAASDAGSVIAFEVRGTPDQPTLNPLWVSEPFAGAAPAVIANGMLFVLSTAGAQQASAATLHVLDAITGKDLQSSSLPAGAVPSGGLALANGRIYVTARDNAVYCFGIPAQQEQLSKQ